ncbi:hypothetical protein ES703_78611 [subsurface metagenome]
MVTLPARMPDLSGTAGKLEISRTTTRVPGPVIRTIDLAPRLGELTATMVSLRLYIGDW